MARRPAERERELTELENPLAHLARLRLLLEIIRIKVESGSPERLRQSTLDDLSEVTELAKKAQDEINQTINRRNLR